VTEKRNSRVLLVAVVILLVFITWSFFNFKINDKEHRQHIKQVHQLDQKASELLQNILIIENRGAVHFDDIKNSELAIEELKLAINDGCNDFHELYEEIDELLLNSSRFKSIFAVYLNSTAYLPIVIEQVRERLNSDNQKKSLRLLNDLERKVLIYTQLNMGDLSISKEVIEMNVKSLRLAYGESPSDSGQLFESLEKHIEVLVKYAGGIKKLNVALLSNEVSFWATDSIEKMNARFNEQVSKAEAVKMWFYIFIFLLSYALVVLWRMQRKALKEFSDSANMLEIAMKSSKQTQFSIDIASGAITLGKDYSATIKLKSKEFILSIDEWLANIHLDDRDLASRALSKSIMQGVPFNLEYRWKSRRAKWLWVHTVGERVDDNKPAGLERIVGISTDISERKREEHVFRMLTESNVRRSGEEDIFHLIVKELAMSQETKYAMLATIDENHNVATTRAIWTGETYAENFSYDLKGTPCEKVLEDGACFYPDNVAKFFPKDKLLVDMDVHSYSGYILRSGDNKALGLIAVLGVEGLENSTRRQSLMKSLATRVSIELEKEEAEKQLENLAHYDPLTGCANRSLLDDRFSQAKAHAKRTQTLTAVCFVDLDDFKPVNDLYGHEVGDRLLIEVASRLSKSVRGEDTVSRLGGDEFLLLLGEVNSVEEVSLSLKRVISAISMPYKEIDKEINISSSIGFVLSSAETDDIDVLIRQADQAMYEAKSTGKNKACLFNNKLIEQESMKHQQLESIKKGIDREEMCLFYQPKVNMQTGKVYGAEALIRWNHPEKGLLPPDEILPMIENTAVEIALGNWVIYQAVGQIDAWNQIGIRLEVSINVSSYHLLANDFLVALELALDQYSSVEPSQLQLEILESSVIGDLEKISEILMICREKFGLSIALDDFGTGYSSLAHLRHLPASVIKIDRVFVKGLLEDKGDYEIVKGVVNFSQAFNLDVIAEGVETDEQGMALLQIGCQYGQGYGIAKPMPGKEISGWLNSYQANRKWLDYDTGIYF